MTFLVSMAPVVELRGAIPLGVAHGLSLPLAAAISIVGNMVPVPFIILFIRKIFIWLKKRSTRIGAFILRLEQRADRQSKLVIDYQMIGLFILVAIPLPGTGAWTGALVAALLELRLKNAIPAIFAGVCLAACIVSWLTYTAVSIGS
ncbi:MAG: small multidrug export protein [Clostridia bacterium]|nr:small multidrug export protein [Clostridia bacterium]